MEYKNVSGPSTLWPVKQKYRNDTKTFSKGAGGVNMLITNNPIIHWSKKVNYDVKNSTKSGNIYLNGASL